MNVDTAGTHALQRRHYNHCSCIHVFNDHVFNVLYLLQRKEQKLSRSSFDKGQTINDSLHPWTIQFSASPVKELSRGRRSRHGKQRGEEAGARDKQEQDPSGCVLGPLRQMGKLTGQQ